MRCVQIEQFFYSPQLIPNCFYDELTNKYKYAVGMKNRFQKETDRASMLIRTGARFPQSTDDSFSLFINAKSSEIRFMDMPNLDVNLYLTEVNSLPIENYNIAYGEVACVFVGHQKDNLINTLLKCGFKQEDPAIKSLSIKDAKNNEFQIFYEFNDVIDEQFTFRGYLSATTKISPVTVEKYVNRFLEIFK